MFVHSQDEVAEVLSLAASGETASHIANRTGLPRSTVRGWLAGKTPRPRENPDVPPSVERLSRDYTYLLGMYLGDGCISRHPREVYRLRICLDRRYSGIVAECRAAIQRAVPSNRVGLQLRSSNYTGTEELTTVELSAYSKRWPTLFPQHGPGKKHERRIELVDWQLQAVELDPRGLLRGLIQSDGCRFINTGRNWRHPRYSFTNLSADIRTIFTEACELLGVRYTHAPRTVYVSRKNDVALLDEFIGPKL